MKNVLILGIGNILRKDDGIGVHVARELLTSGVPIPQNIEILEGGTSGFNLLPLMMGRDRIVIIDALLTDDAPGSVYRFPVHCVKPGDLRALVPSFNIRDLMLQARFAGDTPEVEVIGIVPEDIDSLEIGLSDSVRNSMPAIIREVLRAATV